MARADYVCLYVLVDFFRRVIASSKDRAMGEFSNEYLSILYRLFYGGRSSLQ